MSCAEHKLPPQGDRDAHNHPNAHQQEPPTHPNVSPPKPASRGGHRLSCATPKAGITTAPGLRQDRQGWDNECSHDSHGNSLENMAPRPERSPGAVRRGCSPRLSARPETAPAASRRSPPRRWPAEPCSPPAAAGILGRRPVMLSNPKLSPKRTSLWDRSRWADVPSTGNSQAAGARRCQPRGSEPVSAPSPQHQGSARSKVPAEPH